MSGGHHRVAFASVVDRTIALGDPERGHVRLTPTGLDHHVIPAHPGEEEPQPAPIHWEGIHRVTVDAPTVRTAFPGTVAALGAFGLAALGLHDVVPGTADLTIEVATAAGPRSLACHGFFGRGYPHARAAAVAGLLDLIVDDPAVRARLSEPVQVLTAVAQVARRGVTRDRARDELQARLLPR